MTLSTKQGSELVDQGLWVRAWYWTLPIDLWPRPQLGNGQGVRLRHGLRHRHWLLHGHGFWHGSGQGFRLRCGFGHGQKFRQGHRYGYVIPTWFSWQHDGIMSKAQRWSNIIPETRKHSDKVLPKARRHSKDLFLTIRKQTDIILKARRQSESVFLSEVRIKKPSSKPGRGANIVVQATQSISGGSFGVKASLLVILLTIGGDSGQRLPCQLLERALECKLPCWPHCKTLEGALEWKPPCHFPC